MQDDGVAQCLGAFYAAHKQELFTYAFSITRSPACAEDAVHDAFSRVLAKGRLPVELRPYIFRCVRNASLDVLRAAGRERQKMEGCVSIFQEGCNVALHETATELLMLLSNKEREIVVLKIYSGLTLREIAKVYGRRPGTVAATYWRSLQKIRERLRAAADGGSTVQEQLQ